MSRQATAIQFETYGGGLVDLLDPSAESFTLEDVARSLSRLCRYNGHSQEFYSVAQHSCVVADLLPEEHRIHGLLHDGREFAVGDMASPVKRAIAMRCPSFADAFRAIEEGIHAAIYEKAGIALPSPEVEALVKRADLIALATEQREIMRSPNDWALPFPAAPRRIRAVDSTAAYLMFADALAECGVLVETIRRPRAA
ncbi:hypothetical protein [Methylobacterium sp. WCS2018Hpa-22]|uniref:hypothetical protein n=1 Tax=Methylobacterium sp. WCS2018Hpa-22 TaxID=3073633 RepID=UPI00288BA0E6|nr:hypothetical protein [Methylobacterium sp. WCS2018Hpa-22]